MQSSSTARSAFKKAAQDRTGLSDAVQLHIDIMAVLAGLSEGSAQDVIIAVLAAGLDKETNSVLQNIRKFGSIEAFWQLARKYTGYIEEEDKPLGYFAAHVLLTALSQTMNVSVLKGLERFVSRPTRRTVTALSMNGAPARITRTCTRCAASWRTNCSSRRALISLNPKR